MMASDSPGSDAKAANDSRPVDLDHLRRYTLGDRDLEVEILGLFADQLPITIGALNEAASMKEWGIAAHTLKGSARAVGAWSLAMLAETAEKLRDLPDANERRKVVGRLEKAAGEARDYIASLAHAA